jgi:hypothetical protein
VARRVCSSSLAPLWGALLALAALVVLLAPRSAAAATPAGLCDERGLSALAPVPLPVVPLNDASVETGDDGVELCAFDATTGCRLERGRGGAPAAAAVADVETTLGAWSPYVPNAPSARASWPGPVVTAVPVGCQRRVEHPPRA